MLNLNPFKFKWQIRALYANGPRPSPAGCKIGDVYSVYPMFMGFVTLVLDRNSKVSRYIISNLSKNYVVVKL